MYRIEIESEDNELNHYDDLVDRSNVVSTKIGAIDPKKANAEIEVGEYVFQPDKLTLHKALGKRHEKGGTPVNLPDNSFIFSNYKDLAITKKEKELYEFRKGGTNKAKNNTPAKVLEKQIDTEHHNKMVKILNSSNQDDIAKNSAMLMLQKNMEKIGQLAYLQENKKGFPQGMPDFSQNTAPVYNKDVDIDITKSKQFMKTGGYVLPKFPNGGNISNPYTFNLLDFIKNGRAYNRFNNDNNPNIKSPQPFTGSSYSNVDTPGFKEFHSWFFKNNPNASILDFQRSYNQFYKQQTGEDYFNDSDMSRSNNFDNKNGLNTNLSPKFINYRTTSVKGPQMRIPGTPSRINLPQVSQDPNFPITWVDMYQKQVLPALDYRMPSENKFTPEQIFGKVGAGLTAGKIKDPEENEDENRDLPLTSWQRFNATLPLLQSLGVKTQYPYREQNKVVSAGPAYYTPDAQLASQNQAFSNNRNLLKMIDPKLAFQNNASNYGKTLDAMNQIVGQTNQQNQQIASQYNQNLANLYNNTNARNNELNKKYYDETQLALKNRDDYRDNFRTQSLNTFNKYLSENQSLQSQMAMLNAGKLDENGNAPFVLKPGFAGYTTQFNKNWAGDPLSIQTGYNQNSSNQTLISYLQSVLSDNEATAADKNYAARTLSQLIETQTKAQKKRLGGRFLNIRY